VVDELVINTPGHHFYTDTLIAYGLSYPLTRAVTMPERDLEVVGRGSSYTIIVRGLTLSEAAEAVARFVEEKKTELERELAVTSKKEVTTYADGRIGLLSKKDVSEYIKALLSEDELEKFLDSLRSESHALGEGRVKVGKGLKSKLRFPLVTMILPFMPAAGKYLTQDLTTTHRYEDEPYKVCVYCAAFAALGLYRGALTSRWGKWALVVTVGFEGSADGRVLQYTQDLISEEASLLANLSRSAKFAEIWERLPLSLELGMSLEALPARTLIQALVCLFADAAIRGLAEANASWRALSVKFDATRVKSKSLQIRGYDEIVLDPVISALADLLEKGIVDDFRNKVRSLLRAARSRGPESGDAVTALESLFAYFQTRRLSDLYSFVRSFEAVMERSSKTAKYKPSLTKRLCQALVTLSIKP